MASMRHHLQGGAEAKTKKRRDKPTKKQMKRIKKAVKGIKVAQKSLDMIQQHIRDLENRLKTVDNEDDREEIEDTLEKLEQKAQQFKKKLRKKKSAWDKYKYRIGTALITTAVLYLARDTEFVKAINTKVSDTMNSLGGILDRAWKLIPDINSAHNNLCSKLHDKLCNPFLTGGLCKLENGTCTGSSFLGWWGSNNNHNQEQQQQYMTPIEVPANFTHTNSSTGSDHVETQEYDDGR